MKTKKVSAAECERRILKSVKVGRNISTIHLTAAVRSMYYRENGELSGIFPGTLTRNLRQYRQDGTLCFVCVDRKKSIYQRVE